MRQPMLRIIICNDDGRFDEIIQDTINQVMVGLTIAPPVNTYALTDPDLLLQSSESIPTIYILNASPADHEAMIAMARIIRDTDEYVPFNPIIFLASSSDFQAEFFKRRLYLFDFILKEEKTAHDRFMETIALAVDYLRCQSRSLTLTTKKASYLIPLADIIYVRRDSTDRKLHIQTVSHEFTKSGKLDDLRLRLDRRSFSPHRSCIINLDHVAEIDYIEETITFDDGTTLPMLSRYRKQALKKYLKDY